MQLAKHLRYGNFFGWMCVGGREKFSALAEGVELRCEVSKFIHICKQLSSAGCWVGRHRCVELEFISSSRALSDRSDVGGVWLSMISLPNSGCHIQCQLTFIGCICSSRNIIQRIGPRELVKYVHCSILGPDLGQICTRMCLTCSHRELPSFVRG